MSKKIEVVKEFRFEAAHRLTNVNPEHKCGKLHGHSFRVEIALEGVINDKEGWLMDFGDISSVVKPIVDNELDHQYLNEITDMGNPTSENISVWLWKRLKPMLPDLKSVTVHETCTARVIYRGE
jgi:6-pyruvoyltetrahydropterin/6-carboxytetrahydropterin synthase